MQGAVVFNNLQGSIGLLATQEMKAALGICSGMSNKEIARELSCSPATVKKSVERIFYKLGIASRSAVPTELFCRGIARKLAVWMCAAFVGHVAMGDDQFLRARRGGGSGERRVELRASVKRIEQYLAV